jgi:two-component system, sensor histidine kinase and response regulator
MMAYSTLNHREHILAVDDVPDNLVIAQTILEDEGYEVSVVTDGRTALHMVEQSPPDLILLDVMMPDMDGYEVTRQVRLNRNLSFIPILLITANDQSSVVEGLDAGADDFIRKPVDVDELLARVRSLLRLKRSIDERDRTAQLREDFVARFTHDLRIPLVAANRILKLFRQGQYFEVSQDLRDMLDGMIHSNDDLLQLVNSLLEVYRHEAGCKVLDFAACNVTALIQDVVNELAPLAQEKGLALTFQGPPPLNGNPITVMGDRIELRRVLVNLVGNAIKFTETGSVQVSISIHEDGSASSELVINVQDTGPGISLEDQKDIFERFRQGSAKGSGSGLGLYLAALIVKAHRGRLSVISTLSEGSRFLIQLPYCPSQNLTEIAARN